LIRAKTVHGFFQPAFLRRVLLCGLAGYSLYLLSPAIQSLFSYPSVDFWTVLKGHARAQREIVGYFRKPAFAVLAVATLLPLVVLSIHWKSHSVQIADDTRLGVFFTKATGHALHALFFLGSFWLAFDPTFGPRHLAIGPSMLTYYYLSSLVFGYCAGYFLIFGLKASKAQSPNSVRFCRSLLAKSLYSLIFLLPCLLAWRNLGQIRTTNGTLLQEYARNLYADLPPGASAVLSEQPTDLLLLHAQSSMRHYEKNALLLDAPALSSPAYHLFMARHFQSRWPSGSGQELDGSSNISQRSESGPPTIAPAAADGRGDLAESDAPNRSKVAADKNLRPPIDVRPGRILDLISTIAAREPLYYLYPGLGPVLELFRPEPEGCLHRLRFRPSMGTATTLSARGGQEFAGTNSSAGKDDANEQFWQRRWSGMLQQLALQTVNQSKFPRGLPGTLLRRLRLASEPNATAIAVGAAYSRTLNCWGVQMQRLGRREAAELWFERAVQLNPDNLTARINLEYAQRSRRGDPSRVNVASVQNQFSEVFAKYDNWRQIVATDGPVDEPSFLLRTGRVLLAGGNVRQSIPELARAAELAPDWPAPKLWLAQAYLLSEEFGTALAVSDEIKLPSLPEDGPGLSRLMECRVRALCGLGRTNQAEACIKTFVSRFNQNNDVLLAAAELESGNRKFEAGLALLETVLEREPNRPDLLARKGLAQLQLSHFDDAIRSLTTALSLTPHDDNARLYRAIACLGASQLEAARADYQELLKNHRSSGQCPVWSRNHRLATTRYEFRHPVLSALPFLPHP